MHNINRFTIALFLLLITFALILVNEIKEKDCTSPKACYEEFLSISDEERLAGKTERAIIKKFIEFGEESVPYVGEILEEDNALIARLGHKLSQELAELAVRRYLGRRSGMHYFGAFDSKVLMSGIVKAVKCEFGCGRSIYGRPSPFPTVDRVYYTLGRALGYMEEIREIATSELMKIAQDSSLQDDVRGGAIYMISFMEEAGLTVEQELLQLKKKEPTLLHYINQALIGIDSDHTGAIYKGILEQENSPQHSLIQEIAKSGKKANQAGISIVKLLDKDYYNIRLYAARTLGFIEYAESADKLMQLFNENKNVTLQWVVADSLGRMKAKKAIPFLEDVIENHWYPPVRDVAKKSLRHIRDNLPYPLKYHKNYFIDEYYEYESIWLESCKEISLKLIEEPKSQKLHYSTDKNKLRRISFNATYSVLESVDETNKKRLQDKKIIEMGGSKYIEHRKNRIYSVDMALSVEGGWLAFVNNGEVSGSLVYITKKRKGIHILEGHIIDIHKRNNRYDVIVGAEHMGPDEGKIYHLFRDEKGVWSIEKWVDLPGSPNFYGILETGEILINTSARGTIIISSDGSMRMAECV